MNIYNHSNLIVRRQNMVKILSIHFSPSSNFHSNRLFQNIVSNIFQTISCVKLVLIDSFFVYIRIIFTPLIH